MEHISGENFQFLCDVYIGLQDDFEYNKNILIQKEKHMNLHSIPESYDNPTLIFCYTQHIMELYTLLYKFNNPFVLITHNSDFNVTDEHIILANSPKIIHWFTQNLNTSMAHPKISFIPIGFANTCWPHGRSEIFNKYNSYNSEISKPFPIYFYFSVGTNKALREPCKTIIESKGLPFLPDFPPEQYMDILSKHEFSICPEGNGIDSHRIWESLFVGTIPIMLRNNFTENIKRAGYPCILLDKWDNLEIDTLLTFKDTYNPNAFQRKTLFLDYYKSQIISKIPIANIPNSISLPNMNIVLSYIGKLPKYIIDCVYQIRLFYTSDIYLIIDDLQSQYLQILQQYNVKFVIYESVKSYIFLSFYEQYKNSMPHIRELGDRSLLFMRCIERFFLLYNLMDKLSLTNVLFMEIDNLIYDDPTKWLDQFTQYKTAFMFDNDKRYSSGIFFVNNTQSLLYMLNITLTSVHKFKDLYVEMMALSEYYDMYSQEQHHIYILPTHSPYTMKTSKPIINEITYKYFKDFNNSIFDAAGMGIYLFGLDPYHTHGVIKKMTKSNHWSQIEYSDYEYKWEKDALGRNIPYINFGDNNWIRINNLHIHSKDLASALSVPV